jgi:TolA-binding protein
MATTAASIHPFLPSRRPSRALRGMRLGLAFALMIPLAACATKRDIRDLGDEIRVQNREQAALIAELRAEQARLEEIVRNLSSVQDERHTQLLRRIREVQDELELVREVAGASQAGLAAVRDALSARSTPTGTAPRGFEEGERMGSGEAVELYEDALSAHNRGSLAAARFGFQDIVERFPNHALAPEARYYLADIAAREGDLDDALRRFIQVSELHPTAPRVPEALYRAALIHRNRGETDQARALFTRIVNTWPDHEVAGLARAFLGGTRR